MTEVQFPVGSKVRVFKGIYAGLAGTVVRVEREYFGNSEDMVVFKDEQGEEHHFGSTFIAEAPVRQQGKEIRIEDVRIGDEIKVEFTENDRRTTYSGTVASEEEYFGKIYLRTAGDMILANSGWHHTATIKLLRAVIEKHELDHAEIGDNFRVFFPSGGSTLYTFLRKDRWVRETYRQDGGLESSATEPAKKAKEAFDKSKTKLIKAVK
jgi:hypothetical protein